MQIHYYYKAQLCQLSTIFNQIMQLPLLKNYFKDDNTTPIPTINHTEQYDSANQGNCITRHSHFKSKIAKLEKKTFQNAT